MSRKRKRSNRKKFRTVKTANWPTRENGDQVTNKEALYLVQQGKCFYCMNQISFSEATIDHIKPKCSGGNNDVTNLAVACERCNSTKGLKVLTDRLITRLINHHNKVPVC